MELTDYVKEFRALQKTGKIRVADFCRERMLDYYKNKINTMNIVKTEIDSVLIIEPRLFRDARG